MVLYTVKNGDTLGAIAKRHGVDIGRIKRMQPVAITNKNLIMTGDILAIPLTAEQMKQALPVSYTVKAGDTLSAIAKKHNATTGYVQQMNGIKDANKIYPGQVLYI